MTIQSHLLGNGQSPIIDVFGNYKVRPIDNLFYAIPPSLMPRRIQKELIEIESAILGVERRDSTFGQHDRNDQSVPSQSVNGSTSNLANPKPSFCGIQAVGIVVLPLRRQKRDSIANQMRLESWAVHM